MRSLAATIATVALLLGSVPAWGGSLLNGGFEDGSLSGWKTGAGGGNGDVTAVTSAVDGKWTAYSGGWFARIQTDNTGLSAFTVLKRDIDMKAGEALQFQYFVLDRKGDPNFKVKGSVRLKDTATIILLKLNGASSTAEGEWIPVRSDPVGTDGTYTLVFKFKDMDVGKRSVLGVDAVQVTHLLPEPATAAAVFIGLVGIAGYLKRRLK